MELWGEETADSREVRGGRVAERARWGSDEVDSDEGLDGFPLRLEALRILIRHPLQKDPRVAEEGWTWSFQVGGH